MKLWLDDVRPPPEGWIWARTNDEAKELLSNNDVTHCSLDHDLGMEVVSDLNDWDEVIAVSQELQASGDAETGLDLVEWMIANKRVPEHISIHSWNPGGAHRMAMRFVDAGYECVLAPFRP